MKKKILLILLMLPCFNVVAGRDTVLLDTTSISKIIIPLNNSFEVVKANLDSIDSNIVSLNQYHGKPNLSCGDWWLVFSPLIMFIILLGGMVYIGKLTGFDLTEALSESEQSKHTIINPAYTANSISPPPGGLAVLTQIPNLIEVLPPTIDITSAIAPPSAPAVFRASISRFIALISSLLTLVIGVCMSSFFIYYYILTGIAPDIGKLSAVLIALGVGVLPYGVNKVSSAIANNKSE